MGNRGRAYVQCTCAFLGGTLVATLAGLMLGYEGKVIYYGMAGVAIGWLIGLLVVRLSVSK